MRECGPLFATKRCGSKVSIAEGSLRMKRLTRRGSMSLTMTSSEIAWSLGGRELTDMEIRCSNEVRSLDAVFNSITERTSPFLPVI